MSERLGTRARRLLELRREKDATEKVADTARKRYLDEEREFWMDLYDELDDTKSITLNLGEGYGTHTFTRRETTTATITNEAEAVAALEAEGYGDAALGDRKIRKRVVNELIRDMEKSGQSFPAGLDIHKKRYIQISRKDT